MAGEGTGTRAGRTSWRKECPVAQHPMWLRGEGAGGAGIEATGSLLLWLCLREVTKFGAGPPPPSFFAWSVSSSGVWPAFVANSLFVSPGPIQEEPVPFPRIEVKDILSATPDPAAHIKTP